jgi:hypothetical protein
MKIETASSTTPPVAVARVFDACPPKIRRKLLAIRKLVFKTAAMRMSYTSRGT